ncbi:hypothetical protein GHK46_15135 [Sinorhizobium medicae]|uniref:hypothetical protein n=1 Tax=Sinorhizobium medicae TaxID=110321 RepID=UPI001294DB37|nr:hypothetical protein [Sinorhizobium medicae]MQV98617.1 hypothetical protein [Sinorhizobium medicae]
MRTLQDLSHFDPIGPEGFKSLDEAFRAKLRRRGLSVGSKEAEALAARRIDAYQAGIREKSAGEADLAAI